MKSSPRMTRRDALVLLGTGAAAAVLPDAAPAQTRAFRKGAVIRTILKDYAPEELAGGATLFHEHMSLAPDFMTRFGAATAATRAANGLPPAGGGRAGAAPPGTGPGPDPMRDVDVMAEELRAA